MKELTVSQSILETIIVFSPLKKCTEQVKTPSINYKGQKVLGVKGHSWIIVPHWLGSSILPCVPCLLWPFLFPWLNAVLFKAGAKRCWVSQRQIPGGWSGMTVLVSWPAIKALTLGEYRGEGENGGHMAACYSSTCILTGRQAMSQQSQTPQCPCLTLANPLPAPANLWWPLQPSVTGLWDVLIGWV